MANKTCGECNYHKGNKCPLPCHTINHPAENSACSYFEQKQQPTNGDKIRKMSNVELADFVNNRCKYCYIKEVYECDGKSCFYGVLAWLNAPAESEEEDEY